MCDELTAADDDLALASAALSRRGFARAGGATALWAATAATAGATARAAGAALVETDVTIPTADGKADAFFVHPAQGAHAAILMWPDIGGLREAYRVQARRLARAGYAVLAVNHYYRSAHAPVLASFAEWRTPEGQAKLKPMIAAITPAGITADAATFVRWLDAQPAVSRRRRIGSVGYCMGGPYTVRTAAAVPARVGAAASMHGAGLVGDAPDSPSKLLGKTRAAFLFAIGRNDDARAPGDKDALRAAAAAAHRPAEIEVYAADHGWTTLDAPVYDKAEAERAWARMLALFAKL
ncbi:MAG: dienelactone hydrolase family protein [Sphingomonadales bacterium]|nr:dienelactone hydrolase family protein [Sphingomonadales bacterium]